MIRPGSSISKVKTKKPLPASTSKKAAELEKPELNTFLAKLDYTGATTLLDFERRNNIQRENLELWLGYSLFHNGDYHRSNQIYTDLIREAKEINNSVEEKKLLLYKSCCSYALCQYDEAEKEALQGEECNLKNRILLHVYIKKNDEKNILKYHKKLKVSNLEDQLSLAALYYFQHNYSEAINIYKEILVSNSSYYAIHIYVAICYYKLEYYEMALDIINNYLLLYNNDSYIGLLLKMCCLYNIHTNNTSEDMDSDIPSSSLLGLTKGGSANSSSSAAMDSIIKDIEKLKNQNDYILHNLTILLHENSIPHVIQPMMNFIQEAKYNLAIYYIKNQQYQSAYQLTKNLNPQTVTEFMVKGLSLLLQGKETNDEELIKKSIDIFKVIGVSNNSKDTINGRQCMYYCFFLLKQHEEVIIYLNSIKEYFIQDDNFLWNYGIALASNKQYEEAKVAIDSIKKKEYKYHPTMLLWKIKVYVHTDNVIDAYDICQYHDVIGHQLMMLDLFCNECYLMGKFTYVLKGINLLEGLNENYQNYYNMKRGAVIGVFQKFINKEYTVNDLQYAIDSFRKSQNPQAEYIINVVIKKWTKSHMVNIN